MKALLPLLLALPLCAQTAKVVELKPEDAAEAKRLYAEQDQVQKEITELRNRITRDYIQPEHVKTRLGVVTLNTWPDGFEFSEDFRFIVPYQSAWNYAPANNDSIITYPNGWQCKGNCLSEPFCPDGDMCPIMHCDGLKCTTGTLGAEKP